MISYIFELTHDANLLAYAMEVGMDNNFSLSYRDQVLNFLCPLFPPLTGDTSSPHILTITRILVTLSNPLLVTPLFTVLVPGQKPFAYQLAFDLKEGGAQDFLEKHTEGLV